MSVTSVKVGYIRETTETRPGIFEEPTVERRYKADVYRNSRLVQGGANRNNDINVSMVVSIVVDPYAYENYQWIRYVEYLNSKWTVTSIEVERPRMKLTLGGLYHVGETTGTP